MLLVTLIKIMTFWAPTELFTIIYFCQVWVILQNISKILVTPSSNLTPRAWDWVFNWHSSQIIQHTLKLVIISPIFATLLKNTKESHHQQHQLQQDRYLPQRFTGMQCPVQLALQSLNFPVFIAQNYNKYNNSSYS